MRRERACRTVTRGRVDYGNQFAQAHLRRHRHGQLPDQVSGMPGHDGGTKDLVGPLPDVDFHEPFLLSVDVRAIHLFELVEEGG